MVMGKISYSLRGKETHSINKKLFIWWDNFTDKIAHWFKTLPPCMKHFAWSFVLTLGLGTEDKLR